MREKKKWLVWGWLGLSVVMFFYALKAVANTATVQVRVTVIAPLSCVINGNQALLVDFGSDLVTTRVDGSRYIKTLDYTLECKNNSSNAIKMKFQGNATTFNSSALKTEQNDLGIELRANEQPLPINSWLNFTYPNKPLLQAVPVKRTGGILKAGTFSASATLMVAYQ